MAVGQPGEPPQAHAVGQIEPFDMAGAYPILFRFAEDRQFFNVGYRCRAVPRDLLVAAVVLYQLGKIHLRLKSKRHVAGIGPQTVRGQLEPTATDGLFQLQQKRPARIAVALANGIFGLALTTVT